MKDKDYELSTEPKPNPMNIENLQEWMDMPLGSSQAIDDRLWWIIRVPGGWVLLATNGSCFVPEIMSLKREAEMIKGYSRGTMPPNIGSATPTGQYRVEQWMPDIGLEIKPVPPVSDWYNLNKTQTPL